MKLYYPDSRVIARQIFFSVRVVQLRNNLPEEVASATCVSAFESRLNSMHVSILNVVLLLVLCLSTVVYALGCCKCFFCSGDSSVFIVFHCFLCCICIVSVWTVDK